MKNQRIMIIGAGDFQLPIVRAAARRGEVILVAPAVSDAFKPYITRSYLLDVREKEKILDIAQQEEIDAVQTDQTDIPVRTVAYVAENLGLPGNGYQTARLFSEKNMMRDRMRELGLPVLPYAVVDDVRQAREFYRYLNCPIIIKPMGTQGSRGVVEVTEEQRLDRAFVQAMEYSDDGRVLVEKCAHGIEFVCESAVVDHRCTPLILGDTHYFGKKSLFSAKERIFPSLQPKEITDQVLALNQAIVEGFGLTQGITHGEYILDEGRPYLLEIAARGGGVYISSDLIHLRTGLDTEDFLLDLALKGTAEINIHETGVFAGYRCFYLPAGEVVSVRGIDEAAALPFLHSNQLDEIHTGMQIAENTNKTSRFAMIITGRDHNEWEEHVRQVQALLDINVQAADGSLKPIIWS